MKAGNLLCLIIRENQSKCQEITTTFNKIKVKLKIFIVKSNNCLISNLSSKKIIALKLTFINPHHHRLTQRLSLTIPTLSKCKENPNGFWNLITRHYGIIISNHMKVNFSFYKPKIIIITLANPSVSRVIRIKMLPIFLNRKIKTNTRKVDILFFFSYFFISF